MMEGDEGMVVGTQSVPSIGGNATIVAGGHIVGSGAPSYPETPGVGGPDGSGYPSGTVMKDNTPGDPVN